MKKITLSLLTFFLISTAFGQSAKFHDAMIKALGEFDTAHTGEQMISLSNKFERIAQAEKDQWLPYYYASLTRATATFLMTDQSKTDEILDVAQTFLNKADSLKPENSEIYVLKSMLLGGRIMVDPVTRGQLYGMQSMMMMNKAMTLDPSNPRSYFMMGQSLFYTPEQFGGGKAPGCKMLETAKEKYAVFKPASDIDPDWGAQQVEDLLKACTAPPAEDH